MQNKLKRNLAAVVADTYLLLRLQREGWQYKQHKHNEAQWCQL